MYSLVLLLWFLIRFHLHYTKIAIALVSLSSFLLSPLIVGLPRLRNGRIQLILCLRFLSTRLLYRWPLCRLPIRYSLLIKSTGAIDMSSPSGPSASNRQPTWRVHTAPDCTLPSSLSEVHCMLTVSKSRPPTPHVKRSRLIKGPSPMMSTSTEASKPMIPPSQSTNFPILPRLARGGSSKLTAIARRPTAVDLKSFSKSSDALQFDKLESLHQSNSWNQPNISPGSREYDLTSTDPDEDNWRRCGSPERRLSLNCIKSSDPNSTDQDAQKKSTFLHFFRRSVSSSVGPQAKVVDELPKTTETATKSNKKSTSQSAAPMQPRSPRYGSDRDRHSLPEIERIIRMSQKRRDSVSNSNSSSTGGNSSSATGRNVPGRFRSMKIDK